jgi:hypothetical protein
MASSVTGTAPLAYLGVQAANPPNMVFSDHLPTATDVQFIPGTLWLFKNPLTTNPPHALYSLVSVSSVTGATWVPLYPAGGPAGFMFIPDAGVIATFSPTTGLILFAGDTNITTNGTPFGLSVELNPSISVAGSIKAGTTLESTTSMTVGTTLGVTGTTTLFSLSDGVVFSDIVGVLSTPTSAVPGANQAPLIVGDSGDQTGTWGLLTSTGNTVVITQPTPTTINLEAGGGGGGITQLNADAGSATGATVTIAGGTGLASTAALATLTLNLDVPVTIANGGTNAVAMTNTNGVAYFDGTRIVTTTVGTATHVLTSNGVGVAPSFQVVPAATVTSVLGTAGQITSTGPVLGVITLSTPLAFVAPGSIASTTTITAASGLGVTAGGATITAGGLTVTAGNVLVTAGTTTLTPLNTSGMVLNSAAGLLSTAATTNHAIQIGNAAGQLTSLGIGTNGQVLLGSTGANPAFVTPTVNTGLSLVTNAATLQYGLTIPVVISSGGTNATTMTNTYGVNYFNGTSIVTTTVGVANQVLTSNGAGVAPTFQTSTVGIATLTDDGAGSATGVSVKIAGTVNQITTVGAAATMTLSLPVAITAPGSLTTTTSLTATLGNITATAGDIVVGNVSAGTTAPFVNFLKSHAAGGITSGDVLGEATFRGHDSTQYVIGSKITSTSSGMVAVNRIASDLKFYTHPDSVVATTLRMTIADTGAITIAAPDSGVALTITAGGLTVTAGGATITAGGLTVTAGGIGATVGNITATLGDVVATAGNLVTTTGDALIGNTAVAVTQPILDFKKSRAGGVITSGDLLGQILFRGIGTGTTYTAGASITSTSSGAIAATQVAGNLVFATHPNSATTDAATTRMTIASTGAITIAAPDSGVALTITAGGLTVTAGNVTVTSGNLALPTTSPTVGQITINGTPVLHTYSGGNSTFIGDAGNFTNTGIKNIGFGNNALNSMTSGDSNIGIGFEAGTAVSTGQFNTFIGSGAGAAVSTTGSNVMIGHFAGNSLTTTCSNNTFLGYGAGDGGTTGIQRNIAIGYTTGSAWTTASTDNIYLGHAIAGVAGEDNVMRLGNGTGTGNGQIAKSFISGIRGTTTDAADAIAVLISSTGQLGTVSSSIKVKDNVVDMGSASSDVLNLRPVMFNYKTSKDVQFGLIAEEVEHVFPELVAYNKDHEPESVKYHILPALLLNEIKKLNQRIAALEAKGM